MFGRNEVLEHDEGVVPSIVFVMVKSVSPFQSSSSLLSHAASSIAVGVMVKLVSPFQLVV